MKTAITAIILAMTAAVADETVMGSIPCPKDGSICQRPSRENPLPDDCWRNLDTNHDGRVDQWEFSYLEVRIHGECLRPVVER